MKLPEKFTELMHSYGREYAETLLAGLAMPASVSIRANTLKGCPPSDGYDAVPWCPSGIFLQERPLFAADPAWHQGLYYVQDSSSMAYGDTVRHIVQQYFPDTQGLRYLDACAAPGGKTTAAIEALPQDAIVVANEYDRHRSNILLENIAKHGAPNVAVTRGDAALLGSLRNAFDIIAVDAPCSGEGMMRKEAEAVEQWSPALIESCASMQRHILEELWNALRPGGILLYSTCTFNRSENECMVQWLMDEFGAESIALPAESYPGVRGAIDSSAHCYRFTPGAVRGEGLFLAAVRKPGDAVHENFSKKKSKIVAASAPWLKNDADYCVVGDELRPAAHASFIEAVAKATKLLRGGIQTLADKKGNVTPAPEMAFSTALNADFFPKAELDYKTALAYLRGETVTTLPDGLPRGIMLFTYGGVPLGFAKNVGNRANNLFPDNMRLRLDIRSLSTDNLQSLITTV